MQANDEIGLNLEDIAFWEYGNQFTGQLTHDQHNPHSWRAVLKDGKQGELNLQSYCQFKYGPHYHAVCKDPKSAYTWVFKKNEPKKTGDDVGLIIEDVGYWQYGRNFGGHVDHDPKDAYSWKACLRDGSHAGLDLDGYVKARYGNNASVHCKDPKDAYSWVIKGVDLGDEIGLNLEEIATWQYGNDASGQLHHDQKDAYSWRVILKDGRHAPFNLEGYCRYKYGSSYRPQCKDPKNAYTWVFKRRGSQPYQEPKDEIRLVMEEIGYWQYGKDFSGLVHHDRHDAYSWKAILKDGKHAGFDLDGYAKYRYGHQYKAHCKDQKDAYSWVFQKQK